MPTPFMSFLLDVHAVYAIVKNPDPVKHRELYEDVRALILIRDWTIRGHAQIGSMVPIPRPPVNPRAPSSERIVAEFWADTAFRPDIQPGGSIEELGPRTRRVLSRLEKLEAILRESGHNPLPVLTAERNGMDLITTHIALVSLCSPARKNGLTIEVLRPAAALKKLEAYLKGAGPEFSDQA